MGNKIVKWTLDQILSDRFGRYSKYIIQERALPDSRDGLKPVQRRILYAMYNLHLFHNKPFKKSARIVGEVIGKYHPHGDTSIYDALVRISQPWKINMPLIEMHGNNGSIDDDPAAAMRYTEVRLTSIAETMLANIESRPVDFIPNFDDSEIEPTVLPGLFPNLLVNGARGIAAGFATEMPPHNLKEIINGIKIRIKSPNCRLDTILSVVKGPDFPTGGQIIPTDGLYKAFERGSGRIIIRCKYNINTSKTNPYIEITEIPYGVIKAKLVKEIDEIRFFNKIYGIKEVKDETDKNGLKIFIKLTPGINAKMVLAYLLKKTQMQIYYSYNNVAIANNRPKQMSILELIDTYINHQKKVILSYSKYHYEKKKIKLEIINGLIKVSDNIEKIINIIRKSTGSKQGVVKNLINYGFTQIQANAIADLKLYRLSSTDKEQYIADKKMLEKEIEELIRIINDEKSLNVLLIKQLSHFSNKYGISRKSEISLEKEELPVVDDQALIKKEEIYIGISKFGYIKSISNKSFLANEITKYKLKNDDMLVFIQKMSSLDTLIIFTNKGRFLKINAHKIPNAKFNENGAHLNDITTLYNGEFIINCYSFNEKMDYYFILLTKNGQIKKTHFSNFSKISALKFTTAFKLSDSDEVVSAKFGNNKKNIIVFTKKNKVVKYPETTINPTGNKSGGIKAIKLTDGDHAIELVIAYHDDVIGLITQRGGFKRIKCKNILPYSRTSYGKEISLQVKGKPHIIIQANVVLPYTKFIVNIDNKLIEGKFNQIDISNTSSGFSKIYSNIVDCIILADNKNNQDEVLSLEERFKRVEEKINKYSQLSIEELIKKQVN